MNKFIALAALGLCFTSVYAKGPKKDKAEEGFVFTTVKENPITSIKNQNRSSTCWSFSSIGFLESELLRQGKGEFDLSEMFVVHKTMQDRATNYVRYHGDASFSPALRAEALPMPYTVTKTTEWFRRKLCRVSHTATHCLTTTNWMQ